MINYDETKLIAANSVCENIKREFALSHMFVRLNMMNDDINIELRHKEVTNELLTAIKEELRRVFQRHYEVLTSPLLSGSYMDNPIHQTTALYLFKCIN